MVSQPGQRPISPDLAVSDYKVHTVITSVTSLITTFSMTGTECGSLVTRHVNWLLQRVIKSTAKGKGKRVYSSS